MIQREIRKRGVFGTLLKWIFIGFNLLMIVWLISAWAGMGQSMSEIDTEAGQAGAAIGAALGTAFIFTFWALGDIILGMLVFFTRGQKILVTEER